MALVVKDRVRETTTTTGTSDLTLGGAVFGFQTFAIIGNGNTTYYGIYDSTNGDWEVGVGTYSTTGPTLTRDTVFESSNAGSKVVFGAGVKDVFVTYPAERAVYLDAAGSAVTNLDIGTLNVTTANITSANITAGTISTTPTSSNDLVNKTYVDGIAAQGITYHTPVKYEVPNTTGNLNAIYNNGVAGVGATLTNNGTLAAFAPDGPTAQIGDRILVYNQTNAFENGIYEVSTVGNGSTAWVLTRTADADSYGLKDPNAIGQGDAFYVTSGDTGAGETYVITTAGVITFGTTAITFAQISSAQVYSAGTGLTLSNLQFSITPVGTAGTYGSASSVPVLTTNASGQVTGVVNTGIAISAGAVSGLAASATTDTTNAANITSGTLDSARLSGSYTGVTGVGTLTTGTWNASTIGAAYGGTGQTSYTVGDILYADSTTSLAKLPDVATGNALLSGGVGTAPAWGKVDLTTHVSGTLPTTNGGTGLTSFTANGVVYASSTSALATDSNIVYDSTNKRLGLNSPTPTARLHIIGSGLGSDSPTIRAENTSTTNINPVQLIFNRTTTSSTSSAWIGQISFTRAYTDGTTGNIAASILVTGGNNPASPTGNTTFNSLTQYAWQVGGTQRMYLNSTELGVQLPIILSSSLTVRPSSGNDSVVIAGRAGGTGSYTSTITPTTLTGNRTVTLPNADLNLVASTANTYLGWTGSAFAWSSTGGYNWVVKTSNYTAVDKEGVLTDTSGGAFTVTLPATPATGTQVVIADSGNVWGTNNLTIGRNGSTIRNLAEDLVCNINGVAVQLVYDGTTWDVYTQIGANTSAVVTLSDVQTLTNKTIAYASNTLTGVPGLSATNTFTGTNTFSGSSSVLAAVFPNSAEVVTVSATAATGTINYDITTQSVLYYTTNSSGNFTVNLRASSGTTLNTALATGQSVTVAFLVTNGATAYYNTTVQVDGTTSGVTTRWQGGTAPTSGNTNSIDVYAYTIIKTAASTYTVLASQTKFA